METILRNKHSLFFLLTAFVVITLFSRSSFLYPMNDWEDANCYFTVGKSILFGKVPYHDLIDHKGPMLFFIQMIGAIISFKSFMGVYILEVISAFVFLLFSYRTLNLFFKGKIFFLIPMCALVTFGSLCFYYGDSAEEFSLPFLSIGFFVGIKVILNSYYIKKNEAFILGVIFACVFWIKYTLTGFFIGFILYFFCIAIFQKKIIWISRLLYSFLGFIVVTFPILIYFIANKALYDLFHIYFYLNIFSYNHTSNYETMSVVGLLLHEAGRIKYGLLNNPVLSLFILAGLSFLFFSKRHVFLYTTSCLFFSLFFVCISKTYDYYFFILAVYVPLGLLLIYIFLCKVKKRVCKSIFLLLIYIAIFICSINQSVSISMLLYSKEKLPQFCFKKIINQEKNPTVLNYCSMDLGVYTICGIVPSCPYFAMLNINREQIRQEHEKIVSNRGVRYIVLRGEVKDFSGYEIISQYKYPVMHQMIPYVLYKAN